MRIRVHTLTAGRRADIVVVALHTIIDNIYRLLTRSGGHTLFFAVRAIQTLASETQMVAASPMNDEGVHVNPYRSMSGPARQPLPHLG